MSDERQSDDPQEQQLVTTEQADLAADAPPLTQEEIDARHAIWWKERQERASSLVENSRRSWAAMQGWDAVKSQEEWNQITNQAAEDWASGAMLIRMLGGQRYLDPPHTALMQHLWHHFRNTYHPEGPAEYMAIAMALFAFHHLIRVNEFAGNMATRLEFQFFDTSPLQVQVIERDGTRRQGPAGHIDGREALEQFGRDALPLMDRLNRMVIRNLKALRDLKASPLALNVQNFGQLNVGQVQTNLANPPEDQATASPSPPNPGKLRKRRHGQHSNPARGVD